MATLRSHPPSQKNSHPPTETMPSRRNTTSYSSTTTSSTASSTDGIDDTDSAIGRPKLHSRKHSTNLVPRDHPNSEIRKDHFPAGDARAMSPRRTSVEMEKLGRDNRIALQKHAKILQSGLNALAEKIELVKSDHDKLERQNVALQDYIGGLTRSMSRTDLTSKSKK